MKLRGYQIDCIEKINIMHQGDSKICYMATGAGKTIIMATVAKESKGRVLIVID